MLLKQLNFQVINEMKVIFYTLFNMKFFANNSHVKVINFTISCGFGRIYWKNPEWKIWFLCSDDRLECNPWNVINTGKSITTCQKSLRKKTDTQDMLFCSVPLQTNWNRLWKTIQWPFFLNSDNFGFSLKSQER